MYDKLFIFGRELVLGPSAVELDPNLPNFYQFPGSGYILYQSQRYEVSLRSRTIKSVWIGVQYTQFPDKHTGFVCTSYQI